MIVRTDIAASLEYGVRAGFLEGQQVAGSKRTLFCVETTSTGEKEKYVGLGAHPMPREFEDEIVTQDLNEMSVEITNKDWEISIEVDDNAVNDDRVGHVLEWARSGGEGYERHMDKLGFQAINAGDGSTYGLCYDGKALFANDHADSGAGATYTTAQDNLLALTLNPTNFNTAYVAMLGFLDNRGEPVNYVPDLLIHPPALKDMAAQICQNREKAETANRNINPFAGEITPLQSPFLDSTAWILTCSKMTIKPVIFQMRARPELEIIREGKRHATIYSFAARYYIGYGNWRLCVMGNS